MGAGGVPGLGGPPAPREGEVLGGATLVSVLGRGGMGVVWRARDATLGRDVAVKVLRRIADPADLERFRAEGQAAARLRHPHVVRVHAAGEERGWPFLVLDLVEGESLGRRLEREGRLAPRTAVELVRALASALEHAHARGVVHRDVKPANVLLDAAGAPRLADFGLARDLLRDARLTPSGMAVGTPAYMAPEQLDGRPVDARADVWSLGATLHECLTGAPPWQGLTGPAHLQAARRGPPATGVDLGLDAVLRACLAFDPRDRYPSAGALEVDLARWLAGASTAPPGSRAARAALLGALLVAGAAGAVGVVGAWSAGGAPAELPTPPAPAPPRAPLVAEDEDREGPGSARRELRRVRTLDLDERGAALEGWLERYGESASPGLRREAREALALLRRAAPTLDPRAGAHALEAELRGGPEADIEAVAAGLDAARGLQNVVVVGRARALAAEVLERRVAQVAGADPGVTFQLSPADVRLATFELQAQALGLDAAARERRMDARLEGLRRGRYGELLRRAVDEGDARRLIVLMKSLHRTARVEPALDPARRIALARALRTAVWGPDGPPPREDRRHAARVVLEDRLFYELAPEAPLGEGVEWTRPESVTSRLVFAHSVPAAEALALVRGHRRDSWLLCQRLAQAVQGSLPEVERRGAAGSAAARLLVLMDAIVGARPEDPPSLVRALPGLQAVTSAPVHDLPPGVLGLTELRLGQALLASGAPRQEVEARARASLASLTRLHAEEGFTSERIAGALALLAHAAVPDAAAISSAAREGLAVLDDLRARATSEAEAGVVHECRTHVLVETAGLLDGRADDAECLRWFAEAEAAAARVPDYLPQALDHRLTRVLRHLEGGQPAAALGEADACWAVIGEPVRLRLDGGGLPEDHARLLDAARRFAQAAGRAADAAGAPEAAARWRTVAQGP